MRRLINWIWSHGILSTFLTGLFAILPLVLTVALVVWVVGFIQGIVGPETMIGGQIEKLGGGGADGVAAITVQYFFGWAIVLAGIWAFGLLLQTTLKNRITGAVHSVIDRIPIINSVYSTASQLVGMVRKSDNSELSGMSAVYCTFGRPEGAGLLALITTPDVYRFAGRDCHIVYLPTSPVPMTGGILFVPVEDCHRIDMTAEEVMRVYFSLGILAAQVVPKGNQVKVVSTGTPELDPPKQPPAA
ncbi:MAG: DUF502 domain-containing protein [Planctomycetaceae bacterium]|nr:DUF502 domain-containing protein [Planctomycetaceae bacterium]